MDTLHHNTYLQKKNAKSFLEVMTQLAVLTYWQFNGCKSHCHSFSVSHVHHQVMPYYWMKEKR